MEWARQRACCRGPRRGIRLGRDTRKTAGTAVPLSAGSGSWSQCVRKRKGGSPGTAVPKSECRIANSEGISECRKPALTPASRSTFGLRISFVICHSSFVIRQSIRSVLDQFVFLGRKPDRGGAFTDERLLGCRGDLHRALPGMPRLAGTRSQTRDGKLRSPDEGRRERLGDCSRQKRGEPARAVDRGPGRKGRQKTDHATGKKARETQAGTERAHPRSDRRRGEAPSRG